jgi:hypothetical protein
MSLLPVLLPELHRAVRAVIKNSLKWSLHTDVLLKAVVEDDCSWRFYEDDSELDNSWDVIYWEYVD